MDSDQPLVYDVSSFEIKTERGRKSDFDLKLQNSWEKKENSNVLNYNYEEKEKKNLPGIFKFVAEILIFTRDHRKNKHFLAEKRLFKIGTYLNKLNMNRARLKRPPTYVSSVKMQFDESKFHFGKVKANEVLFQIKPSYWDIKECDEDFLMCKSLLLVNVSPLSYGSSLLVPGIEMNSPQIFKHPFLMSNRVMFVTTHIKVLTTDSLRIAVETVLISHDPSLRVGMNSLGAFASVNHLHFHVFFLEESLYLQHAPVKQLAGKCYETVDYPANSFVFEVIKRDKVLAVVKSVMKIIDLLLDLEIAHNVFITRGSAFHTSVPEGEEIFDAVRIYVWPRRSFFGTKHNELFNPAVCEFAGHVLMKNKQHFESIEEEEIARFMCSWTHDLFVRARERVLKHKFV